MALVLPNGKSTCPQLDRLEFLHSLGFSSRGEYKLARQVHTESLGIAASVMAGLVATYVLLEPRLGRTAGHADIEWRILGVAERWRVGITYCVGAENVSYFMCILEL